MAYFGVGLIVVSIGETPIGDDDIYARFPCRTGEMGRTMVSVSRSTPQCGVWGALSTQFGPEMPTKRCAKAGSQICK